MEETQLLSTLVKILFLVTTLITSAYVVLANENEQWINNHIANLELDQSYLKDAKDIKENSYQNLKKEFVGKEKADETEKIEKTNAENIDKFDKYIFVSSSIPKKNLISLAIAAKKHNAYLVMRGLIENSYPKTTAYLQEIIEKSNNGFVIDPELFKLYQIKQVPAFVVSNKIEHCPSLEGCKAPNYDKLVGNVSVSYALEQIAKKGEIGRVSE